MMNNHAVIYLSPVLQKPEKKNGNNCQGTSGLQLFKSQLKSFYDTLEYLDIIDERGWDSIEAKLYRSIHPHANQQLRETRRILLASRKNGPHFQGFILWLSRYIEGLYVYLLRTKSQEQVQKYLQTNSEGLEDFEFFRATASFLHKPN